MLLFIFTFCSCGDSKDADHLTKDQVQQVNQFVEELNQSLKSFDFDFIKNAWSHSLFKEKIGRLGNIGHGVFNHVYETTVKNAIINVNLNLINRVKHSGATLKHINTNIIDNYAEVTYLLIEEGFYHFIKYRVEFLNEKLFLTDIYSFKEDSWFSKNMREVVLLNTRHTALSTKRHEANTALINYRQAMNNSDYASAYLALNEIPETHRISNEFKIAKINTAAQLSDSLLLKTIEEESNFEEGNNIYIDYLIAHYLNDSLYKEEVDTRMRLEIGISKNLLDSLNSEEMIWN